MEGDFVTIFPEALRAFLSCGLLQKAQEQGVLTVRTHDLRDYTHDRHRSVDDSPYGGGAGMVMKPEPLFEAVDKIRQEDWKGEEGIVILMDPQGEPFRQGMAEELAKQERLAFLCGRYEGVDERVKEHLADRQISIGDYVLMGGELPALVVLEAVARLLPGFLNPESTAQESFAVAGNGDRHLAHSEPVPISSSAITPGWLEYPQYTRPPEYRGFRVPEVLLSGHHGEIARWRRKEMLRRTAQRRPDLLEGRALSVDEREWLKEIKEEERHGGASIGGI